MSYIENYRLFIELVTLCVVIIVPLSVHAGVFSVFFDTATAETAPLESTVAENAQNITLLKAAIHSDPNPAKGGGDVWVDDGALIPLGDIDGKDTVVNTKTVNGEISLYTVREGDTLSEIASMYDVSAKTILWANSITDVSKIRPGDTLVILPITGVRHVVKKGDTIKSIATKYTGDVDDILAYNQLSGSEDLSVGDTVVVPNGVVVAPPTPKKKTNTYRGSVVAKGEGSAGFIHPVPGAVRTQGIHGYNGVDYGAAVGTPIYAVANGDVIVSKTSGYNGGYGLYVVVKHPNGTQTLYAHLSKVAVGVGASIGQGEVIGYLGNSGRSTGPHLHFEVRGAKNPF